MIICGNSWNSIAVKKCWKKGNLSRRECIIVLLFHMIFTFQAKPIRIPSLSSFSIWKRSSILCHLAYAHWAGRVTATILCCVTLFKLFTKFRRYRNSFLQEKHTERHISAVIQGEVFAIWKMLFDEILFGSQMIQTEFNYRTTALHKSIDKELYKIKIVYCWATHKLQRSISEFVKKPQKYLMILDTTLFQKLYRYWKVHTTFVSWMRWPRVGTLVKSVKHGCLKITLNHQYWKYNI